MVASTSRTRPRILSLALVALLWLSGGCATRTFVVPTGRSAPYPAFAETFADVTERCRQVSSLAAEFSLNGRVGSSRLRARVLAGISVPDSVRLEGIAPFGAPGFILAASPDAAVLLLPRDGRVLRGATVAEMLDALVGLPLTPDELLAVATGCVSPAPTALAGRAYPDGWVAVDLANGAVAYVHLDGTPRLAAGTVAGLIVEYRAFAYGFPSEIRLRSEESTAPGRPATDLIVTLSQVETNRRLGAEVFEVVVPSTAVPIDLEELRASGPLADASS